MDLSEIEITSNPSSAVDQINMNTKESMLEFDISKENTKTECKEFTQGGLKDAGGSLINNIEILNVVVQHEKKNDKNVDGFVSVLKDNEDLAEKENVKTIQREAIKILNVELIAPRRDDFDKGVGSNSEKPSEVNISSSDIEIVENADQNQALEESRTNGSECSVPLKMAESQQSANCSNSIVENIELAKTNGLSLLAQYQSDDDADSVVEVPLTAAQDYRNQVLEIYSDSDTDVSSGSDVEYINELRKTIEKRIEIADDDDGEDEDQEDCNGKKRQQQKLRVKGELLLEDLPPIHDLQITVPENDCIELGKIHSIVDQLVLVSTLPNSILLNLETIIFLERGQKVLGEVFDVLGQVADPLYCVRFNSHKQIKEKQIKVGDIVYVAPKTQYTQYVILSNLMQTKGSDASWENDMEPPPRFLDYSDDEQEQMARKQLRNKGRPNENEDVNKRPRTVHSDDAMLTNSSNAHHRNHYDQRNGRGSPGSYSNIRPRYNWPHQIQQRAPNHNRSSWHYNYNQSFPTQPPNFRMHLQQNHPQAPQAYHTNNTPAYGMPNAHNMPYLSSQPPPHGVPPMFHQHSPQLMPNSLSIRPPTLDGPPHYHQYEPSTPPPPGSQ